MRFTLFIASVCAAAVAAAGHGDEGGHRQLLDKRACTAVRPTVYSTVYQTVFVDAASATLSSSAAAVTPSTTKVNPVTTTKASTMTTSTKSAIKSSAVSSASSVAPAPSAAPTSKTSSAASSIGTSPAGGSSLTVKTNYSGAKSGTATHYGDNLGDGNGNCKLPIPNGKRYVAWPGASWDMSAYCGACLKVTGTDLKKTVYVQIIDKCPECPSGNLDLSDTAFNSIISTSGVGPESFEFVDCAEAGLETGKLTFWWKSGSSQYWAGIQVRGGAKGIASVKVAKAGTTSWVSPTRTDCNYFVSESGFGTGPFDIQVTFQDGTVDTGKNIALNSQMGD